MGFAWDLSDEKKLQSSFAVGRHDLFSHFVDVKTLSEMLGYYDTSVTTLAKRVLGFEPPKSPQVGVHDGKHSFELFSAVQITPILLSMTGIAEGILIGFSTTQKDH